MTMMKNRRSLPVATVVAVVAACTLTLTRLPLSAAGTPAGAAPPSAEAVFASAVQRARETHRIVLIEFGASWCVWCRNFEAFVQAPDSGPIVAAHFVVTNLVVREREDKKALENAGSDQLMRQWGGENAGLPFYVFLDTDGRKVADSNAMPDGSNIGFPATPDEIRAFMGLIDRTARNISTAQRDILQAALARRLPPVAPVPAR